METLLYKPLFINPQAYYVFSNINGRLEPKTGSGKEPAIFEGNSALDPTDKFFVQGYKYSGIISEVS